MGNSACQVFPDLLHVWLILSKSKANRKFLEQVFTIHILSFHLADTVKGYWPTIPKVRYSKVWPTITRGQCTSKMRGNLVVDVWKFAVSSIL